MKNTALDWLFRVEEPYIYLGPGEPDRGTWIPRYFYSSPGLDVCVRSLRAQKMRSPGALMTEFGAALQLFDGFGENWIALEECLSYLDEWLPASAYVLVIERAEALLQDEAADQCAAFFTTVKSAGEFWSRPIVGNGRFDRPAVPFHVLLNLSVDAPGDRLVRAAYDADVALRVDRL